MAHGWNGFGVKWGFVAQSVGPHRESRRRDTARCISHEIVRIRLSRFRGRDGDRGHREPPASELQLLIVRLARCHGHAIGVVTVIAAVPDRLLMSRLRDAFENGPRRLLLQLLWSSADHGGAPS